MEITLSELALRLGGRIIGDATLVIRGVNSLDEAGDGELSFLANPKYQERLRTTRAAAVLVRPETECPGRNLLVVADPYVAFGQALDLFHAPTPPTPGIHPRAFIEEGAGVDPAATIYPQVYVGKNARIAAGAVLHPGVVVGAGVTIGESSVLFPNVTVYPGCIIGKRVTLHAGVVVGSDGFGFAMPGQENRKIPQVGIVQIDDDVEIGANTTIDRATLGKTWIQKGVKIDNLVQIAHNVVIGENAIIVAQVGISGSTKIGRSVLIGGQAGLVGHISVGDHAMVAARAGITKDVPAGQIYAGAPQQPYREWLRAASSIPKLPEMRKKIALLNKRVAALEKTIKEKEGEIATI
ncbi:MAG TPA: UDP-3-O-(3-hydroxymyristoyl)glucosamine N-acyltransferase [Syntrophales bacterium]|nr:UDP-3-O-(3-hydroxymyristoyl)glucosamine N-acyltransferase [Syntrophales bacterium]